MSEVELDIKTIYSYDTHRNIPWNIVQYQPLREYLDPNQMIDDRKRKKGEAKAERYVTRRGFFLDQHIKYVKDLPAPCLSLLIQANISFQVNSIKLLI